MRHDRLISVLVLIMAGCSASGDDMEQLVPLGASERPRTDADELTDELDPAKSGGGYGMLLFDTTSSMNTVRPSTGNTRCIDAKTMARGIITEFFDPTGTNGDGLALWGFTNDGSTTDDVQPIITEYYTDAESAKNALNTLSCQGSAALADALCKGFSGDGETFTLSPPIERMFVVTDGIENSSDGACAGPSGSTTTPGTWQQKVYAELLASGVIVDSRYWLSSTLLASPASLDDLAAAEEEPFDPVLEELLLVADVEELPQAKIDELMGSSAAAGDAAGDAAELSKSALLQEIGLLAEMAKASGGSWGVVEDDDAQYPLESKMDPATGPVHPVTKPAAPAVAEEAQ